MMKRRKPRPTVEECYREIGAAVRHYRAARGMSQAELAARLGTTRASIANLEAASQRTMVHHLPVLAGALHVKVRDLLPRGW